TGMRPGEGGSQVSGAASGAAASAGRRGTINVNTDPAPGVLLSVKNISKTYTTRKSTWFTSGSANATKAVDGVTAVNNQLVVSAS
ncbi:MAG: hypothetical protein REI45_13850, partial [Propionicimonas sp.]|nr:hypothetical protein [Propionicimonas sp.]